MYIYRQLDCIEPINVVYLFYPFSVILIVLRDARVHVHNYANVKKEKKKKHVLTQRNKIVVGIIGIGNSKIATPAGTVCALAETCYAHKCLCSPLQCVFYYPVPLPRPCG